MEAVDKFIDKCRKDIAVGELSGPTRSNLNDNEQKALKRLRQRKDIVIKPADKGGCSCCVEKGFVPERSRATVVK